MPETTSLGTINVAINLDLGALSKNSATAQQEINAVDGAVQHLTQTVNITNTTINNAAKSTEAMGKGFKGSLIAANLLASGLQGAAGLLEQGLSRALKVTGDTEESLNVLRVTTQASDEQFKQLSATARQLGSDVKLPGTNSAIAAESMTELSRAGISLKDTMEGARGVLLLVDATQASGADSARAVAAALNTYGLAGNQATRVANLYAAANLNGVKDLGSLTDAIKTFGPVAHDYNISLDDSIVLLTELAKAGIQGEYAGTALRGAWERLASAKGKVADVLKDLGVQIYDSSGKMLDARTIIGELQQAEAHLSEEQRNHANTVLFGARAQGAMNILIQGGVEKFDALRQKMVGSNSAEELAEAHMKGFNGAMKALNTSTDSFLEKYGSRFIGFLSSVVGIGTDAIGVLDRYIAKQDQAAKSGSPVSPWTSDWGFLPQNSADLTEINKRGQDEDAFQTSSKGKVSGLIDHASQMGKYIDLLKDLRKQRQQQMPNPDMSGDLGRAMLVAGLDPTASQNQITGGIDYIMGIQSRDTAAVNQLLAQMKAGVKKSTTPTSKKTAKGNVKGTVNTNGLNGDLGLGDGDDGSGSSKASDAADDAGDAAAEARKRQIAAVQKQIDAALDDYKDTGSASTRYQLVGAGQLLDTLKTLKGADADANYNRDKGDKPKTAAQTRISANADTASDYAAQAAKIKAIDDDRAKHLKDVTADANATIARDNGDQFAQERQRVLQQADEYRTAGMGKIAVAQFVGAEMARIDKERQQASREAEQADAQALEAQNNAVLTAAKKSVEDNLKLHRITAEQAVAAYQEMLTWVEKGSESADELLEKIDKLREKVEQEKEIDLSDMPSSRMGDDGEVVTTKGKDGSVLTQATDIAKPQNSDPFRYLSDSMGKNLDKSVEKWRGFHSFLKSMFVDLKQSLLDFVKEMTKNTLLRAVLGDRSGVSKSAPSWGNLASIFGNGGNGSAGGAATPPIVAGGAAGTGAPGGGGGIGGLGSLLGLGKFGGSAIGKALPWVGAGLLANQLLGNPLGKLFKKFRFAAGGNIPAQGGYVAESGTRGEWIVPRTPSMALPQRLLDGIGNHAAQTAAASLRGAPGGSALPPISVAVNFGGDPSQVSGAQLRQLGRQIAFETHAHLVTATPELP